MAQRRRAETGRDHSLQSIQRTGGVARGLVDVRIDHRRLQAVVAEEELDRADVGSLRQQMGRKCVSQRMYARMLAHARLIERQFESALHRRVRGMPSKHPTGLRAWPNDLGREYELPSEAARGVGVLPVQCTGQRHKTLATCRVMLVQGDHSQQMLLKRCDQSLRQHCCAVFSALAASNADCVGTKVDVLDAQRHAFGDPQPGAVEHLSRQSRRALHRCQDVAHLLDRQHDRYSPGTLDPLQTMEGADVLVQNVAVQEQQGIERLRLG